MLPVHREHLFAFCIPNSTAEGSEILRLLETGDLTMLAGLLFSSVHSLRGEPYLCCVTNRKFFSLWEISAILEFLAESKEEVFICRKYWRSINTGLQHIGNLNPNAFCLVGPEIKLTAKKKGSVCKVMYKYFLYLKCVVDNDQNIHSSHFLFFGVKFSCCLF